MNNYLLGIIIFVQIGTSMVLFLQKSRIDRLKNMFDAKNLIKDKISQIPENKNKTCGVTPDGFRCWETSSESPKGIKVEFHGVKFNDVKPGDTLTVNGDSVIIGVPPKFNNHDNNK